MPSFLFSNDFTKLERRVYMKAARFACRELGCEQADATIEIRKVNLGRHTKGGLGRLDKDRFTLALHRDNDPCEIVHTLGHELIHFAQFMRGDLDERSNGFEAPPTILWKGKAYGSVDIRKEGGKAAYLALPWEKEAFAKHEELFRKVTDHIPAEDRIALDEEASDRVTSIDLIDLLRMLARAS